MISSTTQTGDNNCELNRVSLGQVGRGGVRCGKDGVVCGEVRVRSLEVMVGQ